MIKLFLIISVISTVLLSQTNDVKLSIWRSEYQRTYNMATFWVRLTGPDFNKYFYPRIIKPVFINETTLMFDYTINKKVDNSMVYMDRATIPITIKETHGKQKAILIGVLCFIGGFVAASVPTSIGDAILKVRELRGD